MLLPLSGRLAVSVRAAATLEAKPTTDMVLIPGGKGKATHMKKGDIIKIVNTHGLQVLEGLTWQRCRPLRPIPCPVPYTV